MQNQKRLKLNIVYCAVLFVTAFLPIVFTIWTKEYNLLGIFILSLIVFAIQGACQIVAGTFLLKQNKTGWTIGFIHTVSSLLIITLHACYTLLLFMGVGFVSLFSAELSATSVFWHMVFDFLYLDVYIFGLIYYLVQRKRFIPEVTT